MNLSLRSENQRLSPLKAESGPGLKLVVSLLLVVTATAVFYAYTRISALEFSYRVSAAVNTQRELKEQARHLKVELSHLRSPERLERAGQQLGLAGVRPDQVRVTP